MAKLHGTGSDRRCIAWVDGEWVEGNPPLIAPFDNAAWLGSMVFDGARAFGGLAPDLDRHAARLLRSARALGMAPPVDAGEIERIAREGIGRFDAGAELYLSPMMWVAGHFIEPDPAETRFVFMIIEAPLTEPKGFSACLASVRRPARDMAPTDAKAACLYPNVVRGMADANARGFDMGVVLDPNGNVAEFSFSNLFMVKDGVVHTPAVNGTFLNGITRQRVIGLLRDAGHEVVERAIDYAEVREADELFSTGNYSKVVPCTRIEERELGIGPLTSEARRLYFDWARASTT